MQDLLCKKSVYKDTNCFLINAEYLNNSPLSLNEDEIDSSRAMHSRFTLQIEKPPSFSDILSNIPSSIPSPGNRS